MTTEFTNNGTERNQDLNEIRARTGLGKLTIGSTEAMIIERDNVKEKEVIGWFIIRGTDRITKMKMKEMVGMVNY